MHRSMDVVAAPPVDGGGGRDVVEGDTAPEDSEDDTVAAAVVGTAKEEAGQRHAADEDGADTGVEEADVHHHEDSAAAGWEAAADSSAAEEDRHIWGSAEDGIPVDEEDGAAGSAVDWDHPVAGKDGEYVMTAAAGDLSLLVPNTLAPRLSRLWWHPFPLSLLCVLVPGNTTVPGDIP